MRMEALNVCWSLVSVPSPAAPAGRPTAPGGRWHHRDEVDDHARHQANIAVDGQASLFIIRRLFSPCLATQWRST
jgi:hypothetical protein